MEDDRFATVILDDAIDKSLDYAIPQELWGKIYPGVRVEVPVKTSVRRATVLELKKSCPFARVRPLNSLASEKPLISEALFQLAKWMARYYGSPLGRVIRFLLPPSVRKGMKEKRQLFVKVLLSRPELAKLCEEKRGKSEKQAALLDVLLQSSKGMLLSELLEKSQAQRASLAILEKKGVVQLEPIAIDRSPLSEHEFFKTRPKQLSAEQKESLDKILHSLQGGFFQTHLLYGVTGSGKTEVYLQAIDAAISQNKSALLLVPEISLTEQTTERLRARFEDRIAILHHRLGEGERRDLWHKIHEGKIRLVVGARSAVFSPLENLGLIIVDEEHDGAYKQSDDGPCYHARDVAVMRGKLEKATVILGSATPSLESYTNATAGKYVLSTLKTRAESAELPQVTVVDMRPEFAKAKGFTLFSEHLLEGIKKRLDVGEQTILFLNRRGFHSSLLCLSCGKTAECPHCKAALTFHKGNNALSCHLCQYEVSPPPRKCPSCHAEESFKFKGAGTEQVERALHAIFPAIRTLRVDADTTRHKGSHEKLLKQFRSGKADVLIGTQMIAKGLHFPSVTLVGVLHADAALQIPDFRAAETVFQLITQVSGRSGRGALSGEVILQTHLPDHPVILQAADQDYSSFYLAEIESRKLFDYPPFSHLVKLVFSGKAEKETALCATEARERLIFLLPPSFEITPAIPCGHAKIKDLFRYQFLIKGKSAMPVMDALKKLPPLSRQIRMLTDVDPLSTYF